MSLTSKNWKKALVIAACMELPLLVTFANVTLKSGWQEVTYHVLGLYHLVPIAIFGLPFAWLRGHVLEGDQGKPTWLALFWSTIYAGQVALTTPMIFYIIKSFARRRIAPRVL